VAVPVFGVRQAEAAYKKRPARSIDNLTDQGGIRFLYTALFEQGEGFLADLFDHRGDARAPALSLVPIINGRQQAPGAAIGPEHPHRHIQHEDAGACPVLCHAR
jgi:hypothetical protein